MACGSEGGYGPRHHAATQAGAHPTLYSRQPQPATGSHLTLPYRCSSCRKRKEVQVWAAGRAQAARLVSKRSPWSGQSAPGPHPRQNGEGRAACSSVGRPPATPHPHPPGARHASLWSTGKFSRGTWAVTPSPADRTPRSEQRITRNSHDNGTRCRPTTTFHRP